MLAEFRTRYPQGSLVSELIDIDQGLYLVKVAIQVEGITLATGLAAMDKIELAEDRARERAISALALEVNSNLDSQPAVEKVASSSPPSPKLTEPVLAAVTNHAPRVENTISYQPAQDNSPLPNLVTSPRASQGAAQTKVTSESSTVESEASISVTKSTTPSELSTAARSSSELTDQPSEQVISNLDNQKQEPALEVNTDLNQGTLFPQTENLPSSAVTETLPNLPDITEQSFPEVQNEPDDAVAEVVEIDFNHIKHQTDIEIKRLGWTRDDGRNFLQSHYGKRSRLHLTDEELLEFLHYLESLPTPVSS